MSNEVAFYSPDTDPTIPGTLTDVASIVPSLKGYKGAPSGAATLLPALAATCQGFATLKKTDNSTRTFAGTATKLYEASTSSWTDVSRVSAYGLAADARWSFAQFGNVSLAANKADLLQFSNGSGAFADVAAAPKAALVETADNFVFVANTNEATYGDCPNRIWWSGLNDYTTWAPSITTQAGTTLLTSRPGGITNIKRFGNGIVAYKAESMYFGTYQGAPVLWDFEDVPGEIGCPSPNSVVNIGTPDDPRHLFMGAYDFYQFDGARPIPIGTPLRETVFNEINQTYIASSYALHDKLNSRVYFYYPAGGATSPNKCVVYNYKTNRWGRDDQSIECAAEYITASLTYGDLGTYYATYNDFPNVSYGSALFLASTASPAIFKTDHILYKLTGAAGASSVTTGDYGDEVSFKLLRRVKPQFIKLPMTASMTNFYRNSLGDTLTQDVTTNIDTNNRFDVLRSARWHRASLAFNGDVELNSLAVDFKENGSE